MLCYALARPTRAKALNTQRLHYMLSWKQWLIINQSPHQQQITGDNTWNTHSSRCDLQAHPLSTPGCSSPSLAAPLLPTARSPIPISCLTQVKVLVVPSFFFNEVFMFPDAKSPLSVTFHRSKEIHTQEVKLIFAEPLTDIAPWASEVPLHYSD